MYDVNIIVMMMEVIKRAQAFPSNLAYATFVLVSRHLFPSIARV